MSVDWLSPNSSFDKFVQREQSAWTANEFFLDPKEKPVIADHNFIALLILPVLCVTGLIGNVLVCIAIWTDKRLHNVTNYFLFSLGLADLFVCTIVMPLAILVEVKHGMWIWSFGLCLLFTYADVFLCSASIVHISVISLDRYVGISRPFKVRNKSRTVVVLKICFVWVMTIIISSPLAALAIIDPQTILQGNTCTITSQQYMIYGSTLSFLIPFIIMTITFTKTTQLLTKQASALAQKANEGCNGGLRRTVMQHRKLGYTQTNSCNTMVSTPRVGSGRRPINGVTIQMSPLSPGYTLVNDRLPPLIVDDHDLPVHRLNFNTSTDTDDSAGVIDSKTSVEQQNSREFTEAPGLVSAEYAHARNHVQHSTTQLKSRFNRVRTRLLTMARRNQHRIENTNAELANEHKATRVLAVVFACFFTCWAPFFVTNFTLGFCGDQCAIPPWLSSVILWLGYLSSTLNPLIYTIFNRRFREAFLRILRCQCFKSRDLNYPRSHPFLTGEATWTCMDKSALVYNKDSGSTTNIPNGSIRRTPDRLASNRLRLSERHGVRAVLSHSSSTSSKLMQSLEQLPTSNHRLRIEDSPKISGELKQLLSLNEASGSLNETMECSNPVYIPTRRISASTSICVSQIEPPEPKKSLDSRISDANYLVKSVNWANSRLFHPTVNTRGSFTTQDSIPNIDDDVIEEIDYLTTAPASPLSFYFV